MSNPLTGFTQSQLVVNFQCAAYLNVTGFQNPVSNQVIIAINEAYTYSNSSTTYPNCSQVVSQTISIAGGASYTSTLSGNFTNLCGAASATLTIIRALMVELLSVAQDATNGTACSSVTLGNNVAHAWATGPFGATDTYTIKNGEKFVAVDERDVGFAVGAADILKILNNDGVNAAAVRISIFGVA